MATRVFLPGESHGLEMLKLTLTVSRGLHLVNSVLTVRTSSVAIFITLTMISAFSFIF